MQFALCNEMFTGRSHERVAATAAKLGYHGVEIAPFTLSEFPDRLPGTDRTKIRRAFEDSGVRVIGLHWLLAGPGKFSATTEDKDLFKRTREFLESMVVLCRELGGEVLVFGSPRQRSIEPRQDRREVFSRVAELFRRLCSPASESGVTICLEPLTSKETNFINTASEAVELISAVGHPSFKLHLDVKAMCAGENKPPADVVREFGPGRLHHFHANDPNLLGPGMGDFDFKPVAEALKEIGYDRWISVETFAEGPGPEAIARQSIETLKACF